MYKKKLIPCGIVILMMIDYQGVMLAHPLTKCLLGSLVLILCNIPLQYKGDKKNVIRNISIYLVLPVSLLYAEFLKNINITHDLVIPSLLLLYIGTSIDNIKNIKNLHYITAIFYCILKLGQAQSSLIYNIINDCSRYISFVFSFGMGRYGDSIGLLIPLLSIIIAIILLLRGKELIYSILISFALLSIHCSVISLLLAFTKNGIIFIPVYLLLSLITYYIFYNKIKINVPSESSITTPYLKKKIYLYLLCIASILTLVFNPSKVPDENTDKIKIGILGGNEVDLHTPPMNTSNLGYGKSNSLYGALPIYLNNSGFEVGIFDTMDQIDLDEAENIILINYNKQSPLNNKLDLFVKKGGNLFVFADHTNMMDVRDIINPMIDFSGLYLRDDISDDILFKNGSIWNNNLYSKLQLNYPNVITQSEIQVWGGASVDSKNKFADPVLVGRYATSDPPDMNNGGLGGFLGNRKFDLGEMAGDMKLIVRSLYGKGKVVLFGDTSYIQTPVLASNWKYISSLFSDITPNRNIFVVNLIRTLVWIVFFVYIIFIVLKYNLEHKTIYYIIFTCFITAQIVLIYNRIATDSLYNNMHITRSNNFIYINDNFMNGISVSALNDNSILGLGYNSIKNQKSIMIDNEYRGKAIFLINPNVNIPVKEQRELLNYIYNGGILIISIDKKYSPEYLFETLGIKITDQFLGPVPWRYPNIPDTMKIDSPDFKYAWNLEVKKSNITKPWVTYEEYILVTRTTYGSGLCYVFADKDFFQMSNLEGEMTGNPYNIDLVNKIFYEIEKHGEGRN